MHKNINSNRKETLKELIKNLHNGVDPEVVKERFKKELGDISSGELAMAEEELINEGIPREEIHQLCEVHLAVFRESLEREKLPVPKGHPIHILMEEHNIILEFASELIDIVQVLKDAKDADSENIEQLKHITDNFKESASHYVREENVLFPYLEKHGVKQPPAIMWMEHDQIREMKKSLYKLIDEHESLEFKDFAQQLEKAVFSLTELLKNHFPKENSILFPTSLRIFTEDEWKDISQQFDELGYCKFTPIGAQMHNEESHATTTESEADGRVSFEMGALSRDELERLLDTLPVDITFVDKDDKVRYFNQSEERIFPRAKAVIGRSVQLCHPQKSVHIVNQIVEDFRNGSRDVAEFWIDLEGKIIHIRYFPVKDKNGEYMGTLEVTQNITDIKKLEGQKRLLDDVRA
jgi:PAS domain S-box-containing protein